MGLDGRGRQSPHTIQGKTVAGPGQAGFHRAQEYHPGAHRARLKPSTWREFLDTKGEGVHHIAFEIKGMEDKTALLGKKGMTLLQKGDYEGGRYAYIDGAAKLGLILELLENF